mmetsp:Transcript_49546/g.111420  ORF Transcript_49546/g.111420 Transcript_49546/m.111420 type:complete len:82 (+) Transcript_49546:429-674(+)
MCTDGLVERMDGKGMRSRTAVTYWKRGVGGSPHDLTSGKCATELEEEAVDALYVPLDVLRLKGEVLGCAVGSVKPECLEVP